MSSKLIGQWDLKSWRIINHQTQQIVEDKPHVFGQLLYSPDSNMCVVIYQLINQEALLLTTYAGSFHVAEGESVVFHDAQVGHSPSGIPGVKKRFMTFEEDGARLVLETPQRPEGERTLIDRLVWQRRAGEGLGEVQLPKDSLKKERSQPRPIHPERSH